jgi:mycofactocin precursor
MAMTPTATDAVVEAQTDETDDEVVAEDVLVEDVSIDGMCGVY